MIASLSPGPKLNYTNFVNKNKDAINGLSFVSLLIKEAKKNKKWKKMMKI